MPKSEAKLELMLHKVVTGFTKQVRQVISCNMDFIHIIFAQVNDFT